MGNLVSKLSLSAALLREWKHNGNSLSGMKDGDHRWATQGPPSWPGHATSCIAMTECIFKTCTRWRRRMALHRLANLWLFVYGVMSRTNASVMSCRYCTQRRHDNGTSYSSSSYTLFFLLQGHTFISPSSFHGLWGNNEPNKCFFRSQNCHEHETLSSSSFPLFLLHFSFCTFSPFFFSSSLLQRHTFHLSF